MRFRPDWRQFEKCVAALTRAIDPSSTITESAAMLDLETGMPRERDVWIDGTLAELLPFKVIVRCRQHFRKVKERDITELAQEMIRSGAADVLYSPQGRPVIFDFESSGTGWRALDIGVFGGSTDWMDTTQEGELRRRREVAEFLDGYASIRGLTRGELAVLKLDYAVHHIFLMGAVLRYWTGRDGWYWANDAFVDWHMKWFRSWQERHDV